MDLYIIKVGGSIATEKEKGKTKARRGLIRQVAKEIKKAQNRKKFKLIVVHGAGPFGHVPVKKYGLEKGVWNKKQLEGFVKTHNLMLELTKVFLDEFEKEGLLGFKIQPSTVIIQDRKKISYFDTKAIEGILKFENIIPIMYGDVVLDKALNASVVSGDAIIGYLSRKLKAKKVFVGTDVEGIFEGDPKINKKAKLVKKIDKKNFRKVLEKVEGAKTIDVTGGMRGKLLELRSRMKGVKGIIFTLRKKGNLYNLLIGKKGIGTEISF